VNDTKIRRARGRPRRFDEAAAVGTAEHLFHARGYGGVGVAELAAAMGLNPPSLYGAFGSKAGLFARALAHHAAWRNGFMADALDAPDLPSLARRLLLGAAAAYAPESGCAGCLAIETAREPSADGARDDACLRVTSLRDALAARIAREVPAGAAAALADHLVVLLAGLSAAARIGMDRDRLVAAAAIGAAGFAAALGEAGAAGA